jgi:hypothetical protein
MTSDWRVEYVGIKGGVDWLHVAVHYIAKVTSYGPHARESRRVSRYMH